MILFSLPANGQLSTESVFTSKEHRKCVWKTIERTFDVPLAEDKYDGLADGQEIHLTQYRDRDNDDDWKMKYSYLKVNQIETMCDDRPYHATYVEGFNGDSLNTDDWITGYRNELPFSLTNNESDASSLALPEFVGVENGLLRLRMGTNNTGFNSVSFPQEDSSFIERTFRNGNGVVTTNTARDWRSRNNGGCVGNGRYTIKAKAIKSHLDDRITSSIWFFGWPGEVDLYEQCLHDDCNYHKTHIHQWRVDDANEAQHYDLMFRTPNANGTGEHIYYQEKHIDKGRYGGRFIEYQLEWTPYHMTIRYDGKIMQEFYRYYSLGDGGCKMSKLTCDQIESGVPLDNVWEIVTWNRWRRHFMDLIISTGIPRAEENFIEDEFFDVDFVMFEHKTDNALINGPSLICADDNLRSIEFEMTLDDVIQQPIEWSFLEDGISIRNSRTDPTITLYSIDEDLDEFNIQFTSDNRFSCMDYQVTSEVKVGPPSVSEFKVENRGCGGAIVFGDYPADVGTYEWTIKPTRDDISLDVRSSSNWVAVLPNQSNSTESYGFSYTLEISNRCGTSKQQGFHWVNGCKKYAIKSLNNPATNLIRYAVKDGDSDYIAKEEITVALREFSGTLVSTQKSFGSGSFNSSNLRQGTYYLSVLLPEVEEVVSAIVIKE